MDEIRREPIAIALNVREAAIRTARLRARNTSLEVSGLVPFEPGKSADLRFNGAMDLAILQLLNADLAAKGSANVSATMTGSMKDPFQAGLDAGIALKRSEERRVGKECRSRWSPYH